jgi:hypothetical protein
LQGLRTAVDRGLFNGGKKIVCQNKLVNKVRTRFSKQSMTECRKINSTTRSAQGSQNKPINKVCTIPNTQGSQNKPDNKVCTILDNKVYTIPDNKVFTILDNKVFTILDNKVRTILDNNVYTIPNQACNLFRWYNI